MKYYEQLLKLEVFTLEDVVNIVDSQKATLALIKRYINKGYVKKIKRNLYVCANLENKNSTSNRFVIGSKINKYAFISYHSAFEYYGFASQTFFELFVCSKAKFVDFDFEGISYRWLNSNIEEGINNPITNPKIKITDIERTVIDCIKNPVLSGGKEELFECLESITNLDNQKLFVYLKAYDIQYLYQKSGFIFEKYQKSFNIRDELLDFCKSKVKDSVRYFDNETRNENGVLIKKWNIIIPNSINKYFDTEDIDFV